MSTQDGKIWTVAEYTQRTLALAHNEGKISGGAYAFGTDIAEKLAFYTKPEAVSAAEGHFISQEVIRLVQAVDAAWYFKKLEDKHESYHSVRD